MRFFSIFLSVFISFTPAFSNDTDKIELLNSTLIAKLHLDTNPGDGQMVGAYQVSFRNETGAPLTSFTMLLNPGLQFLRATGDKGETLSASSNLQTVPQLAPLQLNAVRVNLTAALKNTERTEVTLHYKGFLNNLSDYGLNGVQETLHPNFTMIRAQSFAYPVMAKPNLMDIKRAWAHKPFRQVAFVEYPGLNEIIGSLDVVSKTLSGNRTDVELKSPRSTPLISVAIAPFKVTINDTAKVAYLGPAGAAIADAISQKIMTEKRQITSLLGTPLNNEMIKVISLPEGYVSSQAGTAFFMDSGSFNAQSTSALPSSVQQSLISLWEPTGYGRVGHWSNGLHGVVAAVMKNDATIPAFQNEQFLRAKALFAANQNIGKTLLTDYIVDGFINELDPISTLAYAALYDIMGREAFFGLVRGLYARTVGGYTDTEIVTDYMLENIASKDARKFVKNWFAGKRISRDMDKSNTFTELTARYK